MTVSHPYIVSLATATDVSLCGGKAHALGRLLRSGHRCPPGYILLDPLLQSQLSRSGASNQIAELAQQLPDLSPSEFARRGAAIRSAICMSTPEPQLRAALTALHNEFGKNAALVVRSSAVGEDSANHSFAGQLDSFLHIRTPAELESSVLRCWASLWSDRCLAYQRHKGVRLRHMGVVIQRQVDARYSGVLFTSGSTVALGEDGMVIEYCPGLADRLVAGEATPGRILVGRQNGELRHHEPSPDFPGAQFVSSPAVSRLTATAIALEREFGRDLDIEWSVSDGNEVHLLQVRPITKTAGLPVTLWSNANIAENFPDPVSPLLYSIARQGYAAYFRNLGLGFGVARWRIEAMRDALDHVIGVHAGRLYYNLSNIHTLLAQLPAGRRLGQFFNDFVGEKETPVACSPPGAPGPLARFLEVLRIPVCVAWQYTAIHRRIARFEETVDRYCADMRPDLLETRPLADLRRDFRRFMDIRLNRWNNAALADTAAMVCYGLLKSVLRWALGTREQEGIHNDLLKGLPDLASNLPVIRLWELSRRVREDDSLRALFEGSDETGIWRQLQESGFRVFKNAFLSYLEHWGFRSSRELMLTVPSPRENPLPTLRLLKIYAMRDGPSPAALLEEQARSRRKKTREVLAAITAEQRFSMRRIAVRFLLLPVLLRATQGAIGLRERARFRQAKLYVHLRYVALAMGERLRAAGMLSAPEDAFFLTDRELDEASAGHAMFPAMIGELVEWRRRVHDGFARMAPADSLVLPTGGYLAAGAAVEIAAGEGSTDMQLRGTGACGGSVTAHAAVLQDASEVHLLHGGEIAVTRQTDPGWASLFFLVRGLVVERGGMLSHGAIIAREYGIPAVVGVPRATEKITAGATVTVDGDRGVVNVRN